MAKKAEFQATIDEVLKKTEDLEIRESGVLQMERTLKVSQMIVVCKKSKYLFSFSTLQERLNNFELEVAKATAVSRSEAEEAKENARLAQDHAEERVQLAEEEVQAANSRVKANNESIAEREAKMNSVAQEAQKTMKKASAQESAALSSQVCSEERYKRDCLKL